MALLDIRTSVDHDRVVVAVAGEVDLAGRDRLTSALIDAVGSASVVVVDLAGVHFLDSSGVHALVVGHRAARERGGQVYVVNAVGMVGQVLEVTGVGELLRPPAGGEERGD